MQTNAKIGVLALVLVVVSASFAATAFTTGSVERQANVNVVNDDTGLIALADGTSGGLVFQNATGALEIDFTKGGATGVNTAAHYEIGDPNNGNTTYAFNITNLDAESHDITLAYSGTDANAAANIQFQVYDSTNTLVGTADEEGTSATLSGMASGDVRYVVIVVDTHGLDSSTDDLSGTLTVSA